MEMSKTPSPGVATPAPTSRIAASTSKMELGAHAPLDIAALADRANIRPLDIQAALQILLAEVRAAFDLQVIATSGDARVVLDDTSQAARAVIEIVLRSMPNDAAPAVSWNAALARADTALLTGLARGLDAVAAWRDVASPVLDAAKQTRSLVLSILDEEPQNPLWLRPEWVGLAPRLETLRRRRRLLRKGLSDPDHSWGRADDSDQQR